LASLPVIGRLFSGESVDRQRRELMIALVPHIIRRPEITPENLRGVASGNTQTVKVNFAPKPIDEITPAADPNPAPGVAAIAPAAAPTTTPPATAPPATAPRPTPPAAENNPLVTPPAGGNPPATAPPLPPATAPPVPAAPAATTQPAGAARVHFQPSAVDTNLSSSFTVTLMVENAADAASAPMQISFDPKVVRLNDALRGDFLASDGQQPVFTKNIMNDSGAAAIQLSRLPGSPGVSGSGALLTLNFTAVARGTTNVSIPNFTLRGPAGQPIASGNVVLTVNVK
jgi:general secretion pathway protein D